MQDAKKHTLCCSIAHVSHCRPTALRDMRGEMSFSTALTLLESVNSAALSIVVSYLLFTPQVRVRQRAEHCACDVRTPSSDIPACPHIYTTHYSLQLIILHRPRFFVHSDVHSPSTQAHDGISAPIQIQSIIFTFGALVLAGTEQKTLSPCHAISLPITPFGALNSLQVCSCPHCVGLDRR